MTIELTNQESESIFYTALCNGLGYMQGYGLELTVDRSQYKASREHLHSTNPQTEVCYEDILMQVLQDGGTLYMKDLEGDGEMDESITLTAVHDRVKLTPLEYLTNIIEEQDDATDADCVLQTVFFEEIIFG
jgi:hypothetical protein